MKLKLPHKLQAALMAALASVSFTTLSSGTLAAAFFLGNQTFAEDTAEESTDPESDSEIPEFNIGYTDPEASPEESDKQQKIEVDQASIKTIEVGSNGSAGNNDGLLLNEDEYNSSDETALDTVAGSGRQDTVSGSADSTPSDNLGFTANPYATVSDTSNGSDDFSLTGTAPAAAYVPGQPGISASEGDSAAGTGSGSSTNKITTGAIGSIGGTGSGATGGSVARPMALTAPNMLSPVSSLSVGGASLGGDSGSLPVSATLGAADAELTKFTTNNSTTNTTSYYNAQGFVITLNGSRLQTDQAITYDLVYLESITLANLRNNPAAGNSVGLALADAVGKVLALSTTPVAASGNNAKWEFSNTIVATDSPLYFYFYQTSASPMTVGQQLTNDDLYQNGNGTAGVSQYASTTDSITCGYINNGVSNVQSVVYGPKLTIVTSGPVPQDEYTWKATGTPAYWDEEATNWTLRDVESKYTSGVNTIVNFKDGDFAKEVTVVGAIEAGTVNVGDNYKFTVGSGDSLSISNLSVASGATATVENAGELSISKITGEGAFTKGGVGTLNLAGTNDFSGGLTVNGGVVHTTQVSALGSGTLTATGTGKIEIENTAPGNLTVLGDGTLRLVTTTRSESTNALGTVSAGNLELADNSGHSGRYYYGGSTDLSGVGHLHFAGGQLWLGSTMTFAGDVTFGATTYAESNQPALTGSAMRISAYGTFSGNVLIQNDTKLAWSSNSTIEMSGTMTGTGRLDLVRQGGNGIFKVSGNASGYQGTMTTVSQVTLQVAQNKSLTLAAGSNLAGAVTLDGSLTMNGDTDSTISGAISGNGTLTKTGDGTLTVSGNNTSFSGTTTVSGGTLVASSGNALGTGAVNVTGGTLVATSSDALGSGAVTLSSGTLDITSTLSAGSLAMDGGTLALHNASALTTTGNLVFTSGTLDLTGMDIQAGSNYTLATTSEGSLTLDNNNVTFTLNDSTLKDQFSLEQQGNSLVLTSSQPGKWPTGSQVRYTYTPEGATEQVSYDIKVGNTDPHGYNFSQANDGVVEFNPASFSNNLYTNSSNITMHSDTTFIVEDGKTVELTGVLTGHEQNNTHSGTLIKQGEGTLVMAINDRSTRIGNVDENIYEGSVQVEEGILEIVSNTQHKALLAAANGAYVSVAKDATLMLSSNTGISIPKGHRSDSRTGDNISVELEADSAGSQISNAYISQEGIHPVDSTDEARASFEGIGELVLNDASGRGAPLTVTVADIYASQVSMHGRTILDNTYVEVNQTLLVTKDFIAGQDVTHEAVFRNNTTVKITEDAVYGYAVVQDSVVDKTSRIQNMGTATALLMGSNKVEVGTNGGVAERAWDDENLTIAYTSDQYYGFALAGDDLSLSLTLTDMDLPVDPTNYTFQVILTEFDTSALGIGETPVQVGDYLNVDLFVPQYASQSEMLATMTVQYTGGNTVFIFEGVRVPEPATSTLSLLALAALAARRRRK